MVVVKTDVLRVTVLSVPAGIVCATRDTRDTIPVETVIPGTTVVVDAT